MDILAALEEEQNKPVEMTSHQFASELELCGCDEETIDDCLFEHRERWNELLEYFRGR